VTYSGINEWAPKMEWREANEVVYDVIDNSQPGSLVDVSIKRTASVQSNGFVYSAKLHFVSYEGNIPPDTASNIPTYTDMHTFDAVIVHCKSRLFY
jgi:hypothetical protein